VESTKTKNEKMEQFSKHIGETLSARGQKEAKGVAKVIKKKSLGRKGNVSRDQRLWVRRVDPAWGKRL